MKEFICIAPGNSLHYKDTFQMVEKGEIRIGNTHIHNGKDGHFHFIMPNGELIDVDHAAKWITTLPVRRDKPLILSRKYGDMEYETIDGTDYPFVEKIGHIPSDYDGIMAVPFSVLETDYEDIFQIEGMIQTPVINGRPKYIRLLVKKK